MITMMMIVIIVMYHNVLYSMYYITTISGLIRLLENGAPFVISSGGETVLHTAARAGQVCLMIVIVDEEC